MIEINNRLEKCMICKKEYTSVHAEIMPGVMIYVCEDCAEAARHNFIWLCMNCGQVYLRPKKLAISRMGDEGLKKAYMMCEEMQIIQGIDVCISCDPEGILNYMETQKVAMEC
ncbi:MAG: hypothetical protein C4526_11365 [Nitrospiraceae bacterium]|nr:MAG: hypothetical protein C4526_11365 [Nitrospiraceae bacterium]